MANKKSNYTIRLEEDEKKEWVEYANAKFNNNLARMIRVAVHQLMNGSPETNINLDQQVINNSIEHAISSTSLKASINRVEDQLDTINQKLSSVDPKVLEILELMTEGYTEQKNKKEKRRMKHDF
ncbi:MAG: hypothetical protein HeimC2_40000 [Candidatus Heimdallarchaeota archaeon LC_2]|nr:MAG: hypothetical protein HeimC2_40000 [Candidatus Heimdallarchaeota archaeon LC_2]